MKGGRPGLGYEARLCVLIEFLCLTDGSGCKYAMSRNPVYVVEPLAMLACNE